MRVNYVVSNTNENGKHYAYAAFTQNMNIKPLCDNLKNADIVHICKSGKEAKEIAQAWNKAYRSNGTYMFAD